MIRIGQGFDVHALECGRELIIGGVKIPHEKGLSGHSDADVLVHAIMDAIIGALALGDIGHWFPDTDPAYRNADSLQMLKTIILDKRLEHWKVINVDSTIIAQKPKLAPFILQMRKNIAQILEIAPEFVSIKATTSEKLGFCGREEGIAAMAVVLMQHNPK